ncbi:hypothetical protein J7J81_02800 [bacterium]|nr:hypothetical protein [bacterium]
MFFKKKEEKEIRNMLKIAERKEGKAKKELKAAQDKAKKMISDARKKVEKILSKEPMKWKQMKRNLNLAQKEIEKLKKNIQQLDADKKSQKEEIEALKKELEEKNILLEQSFEQSRISAKKIMELKERFSGLQEMLKGSMLGKFNRYLNHLVKELQEINKIIYSFSSEAANQDVIILWTERLQGRLNSLLKELKDFQEKIT